MQSERAVSSRPEHFRAGTIIDALDVTMPDEHGRITSVRICCWRRRDRDRHDFHVRYLLTDRGGYRLDKGLDEERGVEQPVGLLDDRECQRLREGYSSATLFFEKADAFTLDKSGKLRPELPLDESTKRAR